MDLTKLSESERNKLMWNAEMTIEARCEWCQNLGTNNICKKFKIEVVPKANRFCAYYTPD